MLGFLYEDRLHSNSFSETSFFVPYMDVRFTSRSSAPTDTASSLVVERFFTKFILVFRSKYFFRFFFKPVNLHCKLADFTGILSFFFSLKIKFFFEIFISFFIENYWSILKKFFLPFSEKIWLNFILRGNSPLNMKELFMILSYLKHSHRAQRFGTK